MRRAIRLAKKGSGWVNPNPMVGALLVKADRIIGEGYHASYGSPHAEVQALDNAKETVKGATLFVNLEPCVHFGKTPPCAPLIVKKGIKKVVIGMTDPNSLVKGAGIEFLRNNGVDVITTVLEKECLKLNEIFIQYITTGIPFVLLKSAMTLDGKIATVTNASQWITGKSSRLLVHRIRQEYSAIMVGVNTIIYDDPLLNTRLGKGKAKNPVKVIADSHARVPLNAKIFRNDPQLTILAVTESADHHKLKQIERLGAQVIKCPEKNNQVDLLYLMKALGAMGIDSVMIEGGSTLAYSALQAGIVHKVMNFIAPKILGGASAPSPVGGKGIESMEEAFPLYEMTVRKIGLDFLAEAYLKSHHIIS